MGKLEALLNVSDELTPLQQKLEKISSQIGKLGLSVAILTFIALSIRGVINEAQASEKFFSMTTLNGFINYLILAITILVVAIPEGLPLAVTISLAYSVGQMLKENNLVKRLYASETMGCSNDICTDKTGTLTQNKMTVMAHFINNRIALNEPMVESETTKLIAESICYNCSAFIEAEGDKKVAKGNVTEVGLLNHITRSKMNAEEFLAQKDADGFAEFFIPFSSSRKRATAVIRNPRTGGVTVFCKGAPEIVMEFCDKILAENGNETDLSDDRKQEIIDTVIRQFASKCYRTIITAFCHYSDSDW